MQYRLRTLLIVLAVGPAVLAAIVFGARAIQANPNFLSFALLALPVLLLIFAPLWIPLIYVAHLIREREFTIPSLVLFTLLEVASLCLSKVIIDGLPN